MEVSAAKSESKADALKASNQKSVAQGLLSQIKQLGDAMFAGLLDSLNVEQSESQTETAAKQHEKDAGERSKQELHESETDAKPDSSSSTVAAAEAAAGAQVAQKDIQESPETETTEFAQVAANDQSTQQEVPTKLPAQEVVTEPVVSKAIDATEPVSTTPEVVLPEEVVDVVSTQSASNQTEQPQNTQTAIPDTLVQAEGESVETSEVPVEVASAPTDAPVVPTDVKGFQETIEAEVLPESTEKPVATQQQTKMAAAIAVSEALKTTQNQAISDEIAHEQLESIENEVKDLSFIPEQKIAAEALKAQTLPLLQSAAEYLSQLRVSLEQSGARLAQLSAAASVSEGMRGGAVSAIQSGGAAHSANSHNNSGFSQSGQARSQTAPPEVKQFLQSRILQNLEKVENTLREAAKAKDGSTLSFRLDPPNLGSVKVDITQKENTLIARVSAEHPDVQQALRERSHELQQALAKSGIDIERIKIVYRDEPSFEQFSGGFFQESGQKKASKGGQGASGADFTAQDASHGEFQNGDSQLDHWVA